MNFIENQNWRYATKKFDVSKKVSEKDIDTLKEAIRLTASSYGLQPYKILIIENVETRKKLQPASWGQSQIVDASHLLVFVNQTTVNTSDIDGLISNTAKTRSIPTDALVGYSDFMKNAILKLSPEAISVWTSKQIYIALGNLLNVAAELKIDTTPIEGFESEKYNEILGLTDKGLNACVVTAIGYRSEEDTTQHYKKVRKSTDELFITI